MKTPVLSKPHIIFYKGYWRVAHHKGPRSSLHLWHSAHDHVRRWNSHQSPQERLLGAWG